MVGPSECPMGTHLQRLCMVTVTAWETCTATGTQLQGMVTVPLLAAANPEDKLPQDTETFLVCGLQK